MRLVSIDPSTTTCGVAIIDLDHSYNITNIESFTIVIDNKLSVEARLYRLYTIMLDLLQDTVPYQLVHETGFIDRFRPMAYGPLYTSIHYIRKAFTELYGSNGMFGYSPKTVKSRVSTGNAGKLDMLDAVSGIPELNIWLTGMETEHDIDAIAIGYNHILNLRERPELILL